ncbi:Hypothetical protein D9617_19g103130 [Elsinoe fawcettii]|nr:Hypothetical protein D9617_19g103130 [Elsinoe fawcettii]
MYLRRVGLICGGTCYALAAPQNDGTIAATTSVVVVTEGLSAFTFRATQVPDNIKYANLLGPTTITIASDVLTIYKDGFYWTPEVVSDPMPTVPPYLVPSATFASSAIVVTATSGNPAPVVTYTASQNPDYLSVTTKTTVGGLIVFPFGWVWAPVVPPAGLPPGLPTPPPEAVPPEASRTPETSNCASTATPTVTVIISYTQNDEGDAQLSTETSKPSGVVEAACSASAATTTSTAGNSEPIVDIGTSTIDGDPYPTERPQVDLVVQNYFADMFKTLDILDDADLEAAKSTCADENYDRAIPSAAAFIKGLSPNFCNDWANKPKDPLVNTYSASDVKTRRRRGGAVLDARTPPPAPLKPDAYPGWSIDFEWKPEEVVESCSKVEYCNNALSGLLSGCEGFSLADAYRGGSIQDNCGTFSYNLKGYEGTDLTCAALPDPIWHSYIHRDDAMAAIENFCTAQDGKTLQQADSKTHIKEDLFSINFASGCQSRTGGAFTV